MNECAGACMGAWVRAWVLGKWVLGERVSVITYKIMGLPLEIGVSR